MRALPRWLIGFCLTLPITSWAGVTRFVPQDYATIKSAVLAAAPGDTVEVADGYYFEDTIILDKPLTLKAQHPFRAIVCGTGEGNRAEAILVIRSSVVIEGLVLRNGVNGILQRDSPDVDWQARNLAILKMERAGISINDPGSNIGRGRMENFIVDSCARGIEANDAYGFEVSNGLISRCGAGVWAYNHIFFRLRNVAIWDCQRAFSESPVSVRPPRTNAVTLGPQVAVLDDLPGERDKILKGFLASPRFFAAPLFSGRDVPQEVVSRGIFLLIAGDILLGRGEDRRAAEFYDAALQAERELRSGGLGWKAYGGLAACLERQGQLSAALDDYRRSLDMFEVLRSRIVLQHIDPGFYRDKLEIYLSLIRLLQRLDRDDPAADYLCQILVVMERLKARGFIDSLEEAELGLPAMATPGLRQEEADLSRAITRVQVQLHNPYLSDRRRLALELRLQEDENAYTDLLVRIRRKVLGTAAPPALEPLSAREIRDRLLDPETALVEYMLGPDFSVALLATAGSLSVSFLPGKQELKSLIGSYLGFLTAPGEGDFRARKGGVRLSKLLLGPFGSELKKGIRRIIVVPDGELIDLPFESLVDTDGRFLVEKYEFSYVHSASTLVMLQERTRKRTGEDLLAVGVSQPPRPGSSVFQFSPQLSELRHVTSEVKAAERAYVWGKRRVLMDARAEEGVLKRLNWSDYRIIHFAVHGIFDPDHWTRSSLLLWQNGPSDEDGYLQVRDIFPLNLASDLVVLSACQTAKAGLHTGEGMTGLSNIFLFSGSRSVLVSQWNINDRSTAVFMKYFYDSLASGREVGTAVREAKIRMIRSRYRHPFYWAAFNLIGCSSGSYSTSNTREAVARSRLLSSMATTVQR
jgi:CHAT domain-containing protein